MGLFDAIGSVIGGVLQADASKKAAKIAADASDRASQAALKVSTERYDQGMQLLQPYLQAGSVGLNHFMALGGFYNPATGTVPQTYNEYIQQRQQPVLQQPKLLSPAQVAAQQFTATNGYTGGAKRLALTKSSASLYGQMNKAMADARVKQQSDYEAAMAQQLAERQKAAQDWQNGLAPLMSREQFAQQQAKEASQQQQGAVNNIENSSLYQGLYKQGEDALLQNQAATGGIRGGNTAGALAYYRPQMMQALVDRQMGYGQTLMGQGANAAGAAMGAGQGTATQQIGILQNNAQNQGNAALAQGNAQGNLYSNLGKAFGNIGTTAQNYFNAPGSTLTQLERAQVF